MNVLGKIFDKENEVKEELTTIKDAISKLNSKATEKNITGLIALANDGAFSVYGAESRFGIIHNNFGITPVDKNIEASTHGQKASFEYVLEKIQIIYLLLIELL